MEQQKHNVVFASDMSSDYRSGYFDAIRVADIMNYRNRVAAFGAIRRAVEVARSWDCCPESHYNCHDKATEIRIAIRAAIGSKKA